jgi:hypothetical protein
VNWRVRPIVFVGFCGLIARPVRVGGTTTVKDPAEVAVPPGVVTAMGPVAAPAGTVVPTWVDETTVKAAGVPLNVTPVAPFRFVPVRVTEVPTWPDVGVKLVRVGGGVRVTVQE